MAGVVQLGAMTTGHACWPPTMVSQGSPNVIVEGLPAVTMGHMGIPHVCTSPSYPVHPLVVSQGSSNIMVNGAPLAKMGDQMSCTDMIAQGSGTVLGGG